MFNCFPKTLFSFILLPALMLNSYPCILYILKSITQSPIYIIFYLNSIDNLQSLVHFRPGTRLIEQELLACGSPMVLNFTRNPSVVRFSNFSALICDIYHRPTHVSLYYRFVT